AAADEATGEAEAAAQLAAADRLMSWLRGHGAFIDGVRVEAGGGAGRRLVAARDLPAGFCFLRLPASCGLSPSSCLGTDVGKAVQKRHQLVEGGSAEGDEAAEDECEKVTHRSVLYAFLMAASQDDSAPFGPFLAHLRLSGVGTPFSWSTQDRARLPRPLNDDLESYESHILGQYQTLFPSLSEAFPELFPNCTEEAWRRAHGLYSSYDFAASPGSSEDDGVLLPLLDCMNHDSEAANVEWGGLSLEESCGARVTRPVREGEELLYSYGCKGNAELVLGYGFAVWDNPHEAVTVRFEFPGDLDSTADAWLAAAQRLSQAAEDWGADQHGLGSASFQLKLEHFDEGMPKPLEEAAAACSSAAASAGAAASSSASQGDGLDRQGAGARPPAAAARALLRRLLLRRGQELMRKADGAVDAEAAPSLSGPAWERYEKALRQRDSVEVGCHPCAVTPEGCAVATRSSQVQVLLAALDCLENSTPKLRRKPKRKAAPKQRQPTTTVPATGGEGKDPADCSNPI
ncbi:unnamed protein product, partial [Polarella glacialis]